MKRDLESFVYELCDDSFFIILLIPEEGAIITVGQSSHCFYFLLLQFTTSENVEGTIVIEGNSTALLALPRCKVSEEWNLSNSLNQTLIHIDSKIIRAK